MKEKKTIKKLAEDGSEFKGSEPVELTDEQLEFINGGVWDYADTRIIDGWDEAFADGVEVVWRENGIDHIARVEAYYEINNVATYFDLYCYLEGFRAYNVPANEVLLNFVN